MDGKAQARQDDGGYEGWNDDVQRMLMIEYGLETKRPLRGLPSRLEPSRDGRRRETAWKNERGMIRRPR